MKIVKMKNKNNEAVLPDFITEDLFSNSHVKVPSAYAVNKMQKLEYAIATVKNVQDVASSYKIILDTIEASSDSFSLADGSIKIGKGISLVEISGAIFIDNYTPGSYLWGLITLNGNNAVGAIVSGSSNYLSATIPTKIINVKENDIIALVADSPGGGQLRTNNTNTFLCIKKKG
jgi:hypothetical protein